MIVASWVLEKKILLFSNNNQNYSILRLHGLSLLSIEFMTCIDECEQLCEVEGFISGLRQATLPTR